MPWQVGDLVVSVHATKVTRGKPVYAAHLYIIVPSKTGPSNVPFRTRFVARGPESGDKHAAWRLMPTKWLLLSQVEGVCSREPVAVGPLKEYMDRLDNPATPRPVDPPPEHIDPAEYDTWSASVRSVPHPDPEPAGAGQPQE